MTSEGAAIAFGLASAASWGTGDFSGGMATKRSGVYSVIILSQLIGGIFLAIAGLVIGEKIPSAYDLRMGAIAGMGGHLDWQGCTAVWPAAGWGWWLRLQR